MTDRPLEYGLFMPIASNGFLMSHAAPRYHPTFALHRDIAVTAEELGLDYLFWMGKWKGYGGSSGFWEQSLEPLTLSGAVAASTSRIRLIATLCPLLFHPVVAAKMIATLDDVSGGRLGINVVTGNTMAEFEQMGVVPEGYDARKYDYADEWTTLLKRLWTEERVDHTGRDFTLHGAVSAPKPPRRPTIVAAGLSEAGLRYAATHADYSFVGFAPAAVEAVRALAAEQGRSIKVCANVFVLLDDTDEAAQDRYTQLRAAMDDAAIDNLAAEFTRDGRSTASDRTAYLRADDFVGFGAGPPVVGSPGTVARQLAELVMRNNIDGLQFVLPDYLADLPRLAGEVLPAVTEQVVEARAVGTG
jgi:pyrimidine oxygenase